MNATIEKRWSVVVCEGYHDRAFWRGLLLHLGCTDPSDRGRIRLKDPWGDPVVGGGRHGFRSCSDRFVVITPAQGAREAVMNALSFYLETIRPKKPIDRLIVN